MNVVTRGIRNAFRNATRTISIVLILGLTIGLSLVMLIANQAVDSKIKQTMGSIGNTVNIRPVGFSGSNSVNNALTTEQLAKVQKLAHIKSLSQLLGSNAQTEGTSSSPQGGAQASGPAANNTAKTSLVSPFKLNCDKGKCSGGGIGLNTTGEAPKLPDNFSLPINFMGTNQPTNPSNFEASAFKIVNGKAIDGSKDINDAMISVEMAKKNRLGVGSTFTAFDQTLRVAAIFESNTQTANSSVVLSLPALQRLTEQPGVITNAIATVDSLDNLESATSAIKDSLGSAADVTSSLDQAKQAIEPLKSVRNISLYSLLGAVVAGGVIILLTMIMIVRERKREIGILKAIGFGNTRIIFQFMCEALTLTTLGAIIGLGIGIAAGNPVTSMLVSNGSAGGQGAPAGFAQSISGPAADALESIKATVGWEIILYGFGAALLIALIGSSLAASLIAKVRPSEVLRSE